MPPRPDPDPDRFARLFLEGGGQMGAAIRAYDWGSNPLGPAERWPGALKTLVGVMLGSNQPMFIAWGPERIMLYNDGYAPICGQRHPAALGQRFKEVWFDILDTVEPILDAAYAGTPTSMDDIEFTMTRNGYPEETHFSFSYTPVRDEQGKIAGMFCACAETTGKVLARRQVQAERERFARLFEQAPGFMAMLVGPEHRFELVNPSYLRLIGHRHVLGRTVAEALPEVVPQGYVDLLDGVFRSRQAYVATGARVDLQREPGGATSERYVDFVYQPILDQAGATTGIFVEGVDVTERVRGEAALLASEAGFRSVAEALPGFLWTARPDGMLDYISQGWVNYCGRPMADSLGARWAGFVHPDDGARAAEVWSRALATEQNYEIEFRLRRADGVYEAWLVKAVPVRNRANRVERWVGTATLIEEIVRSREVLEHRVQERTRALTHEMELRLQTEEALRQSQKMEAVGQLTGGIAHDFNNLLQGIIGSLELMGKRIAQGRHGELDRYLAGAMASAEKAAGLTHRLLAFSRRQPLAPRAVDVNSLIGAMLDMLVRTLGENIAVRLDLEPDLPLTQCDPNQLENALLNLVINARDAMPEGGVLTIGTANRRLPVARGARGEHLAPGDYVSIAVSDTGVGMSEAVLSRAFDPFFTTKPIGEGTGLGLSMIYGFARQSQGDATIVSRVGEGTEVTLLLPRLAQADRQQEIAVAPVASMVARGETVLVIEDEPVVRAMIVDVLEDLGYTTLAAADGASGLSFVESAPRIDLLITDIGLPGSNGRQVAAEARQRRTGLKILFMTGYADALAGEAGIPGAEIAVMSKPFSADDLARRIRTMIEDVPQSGQPVPQALGTEPERAVS